MENIKRSMDNEIIGMKKSFESKDFEDFKMYANKLLIIIYGNEEIFNDSVEGYPFKYSFDEVCCELTNDGLGIDDMLEKDINKWKISY